MGQTLIYTHPAITCFKLAIETLEEGVKKICLKLTIKTPEQRQDLFLVLVLLTFSRQMTDE